MKKSLIDSAIIAVVAADDALSLRAEYLSRINALLQSIQQTSKEPHIQRLAEIGTYLHEDVAHAFEQSLQDVDEALDALRGVSHE